MTTNQAATPEAAFDDYFGLCPGCHANPSYRNVGRTYVAHCKKCRVKWIIGENVVSSWRGENEAIWLANSAFLADFREVEPYFTIEEAIKIVCGSGGWYVVEVPGRNICL